MPNLNGSWRRRGQVVLLAPLLVAACSVATVSPTTAPSEDAAAYCVEQGGNVVTREATWNTNADEEVWLPLGTTLELCEFEMGTGDDTTRISVDLVTLYSAEPTLASVAYLSQIEPVVPETPSSNPATYNCAEGLRGSAEYGNSLSGGGWVNRDQPIFAVMNLCVFPDMSAIDEFGLFYHQNGTIRGADLAPKFRYQPAPGTLPAMWAN